MVRFNDAAVTMIQEDNFGSVTANIIILLRSLATMQGDLDGTAKPDLVAQLETGDVAAWLMDGVVLKQAGLGLCWRAADVADCRGERPGWGRQSRSGWRKLATGDVAAWLMDGVVLKQAGLVYAGVPLTWQIVGVSDLDKDGKADLVAQLGDRRCGRVADGWRGAETGGPVYAGVPLTWQIVVGGATWIRDGKAGSGGATSTPGMAAWLMDGVVLKHWPGLCRCAADVADCRGRPG